MKPKQCFLVAIASWFCYGLHGQHFEIPIYVEDTAGYKDTIVLGYDPLASYDLDTTFGEINIIDSSYDDNFEVRAAIYDYDYFFEYGILPRVMESKRMIIDSVCSNPSYTGEDNSIMVVIKSRHWPVTMHWDNALFQEECNFIDIIDCTPGGWFDVCGAGHPHSLFEMQFADSVSYYDTEFKTEEDHDTLRALFFRFFSDFGSGVEDVVDGKINFFPNPTEGLITFDHPLNAKDNISVTDIMGRPVSFKCNSQEIDLLQAPDGMYILTIKFSTGQVVARKVIRKSK